MRLYLFVVALALSIAPTTAQELPRIVKSAIAENSKLCKMVAAEPGFITRQDINADGRPDYVLDYGSLRCDGDQRAFCGSLGCESQVFASLPNGTYAKVVDEIVRGGISFRQVKGRPAIVLGFRGDADPCRGDPTTLCEVVRTWNGTTFASTPATRATKEAQASSPPVAAAGGAGAPEETFLIHGQTFKLVPCSYNEGGWLVWKDVKGYLPRAELAKGNMTKSEALAALNSMTRSLNRKVNEETTALYPAHRPISATNDDWSSIDMAEEKLNDVFYGNRAVKELGPWAAPMQKDFNVASALNCINYPLNPIVSPTPPKP
jgi:hypothetical protein